MTGDGLPAVVAGSFVRRELGTITGYGEKKSVEGTWREQGSAGKRDVNAEGYAPVYVVLGRQVL